MTDKEIELVVIKTIDTVFEKLLNQHIASCPVGKKVNATIAWACGAAATISIIITLLLKV